MSATDTADLVSLPVQAPRSAPETPALVTRLATGFGATWVDQHTLQPWADEGGDCVVLFAGDSVRFPEGLDVAVVLPELQRCVPGGFRIGVVQRPLEEALAKRWGSQRWPTLMFLRDGQYTTTLSGMHDWDDYLRLVHEALQAPVSRPPTIGIPVVSANATDSGCH
jgi:hydrogenase-1 operon protein HyaE